MLTHMVSIVSYDDHVQNIQNWPIEVTTLP